MKNQTYNCERCGSENTSSFPMVYQSGTQTGSFQAVSFGIGTGAIGTAGRSKNQNLLSQQTSPPTMPRLVAADFIFAVLCGIGGIILIQLVLNLFSYNALPIMLLIWFIAGFGGYYYIRYGQIKTKRVVWKENVRQWENSWMCLKCGNSWMAILQQK